MANEKNAGRLEILSLNSNGRPTRLQLLRKMIYDNASTSSFIVLQDIRVGDSKKLNYKGYKAIVEGVDGKAGGVAILVPKGTTVERLATETTEALAVKCQWSENKNIIVATAYIRPGKSIEGDLIKVVKAHTKRNDIAVILGDFNAPNEQFGSRMTTAAGRKLEEEMEAGGLVWIPNDEATYYSSHGEDKNILDFAFTNGEGLRRGAKVQVCDDVGSDHLPIRVSFEERRPHERKITKRVNGEAVRGEMEEWCEKREIGGGREDIEKEVCEFTRRWQDAKRRNTREVRGRTNNGIPISMESSAKIREVRKLLKKRAEGDQEARRKYNQSKRELRKMLQEDRQVWEVERLECAVGERDMRKSWEILNEVMARGKEEEVLTPLVRDDGSKAATVDEIVEEHARRFDETCSMHEGDQFREDWREYVEAEIERERHIYYGTPEEMEYGDDWFEPLVVADWKLKETIANLRIKSAAGPDGISHKDIKEMGPKTRNHLLAIFNKCYRIGHFPRLWKLAWIRMLPKKGKDPTKSKSYRPISLTSCLGKLMERLILPRLDSLTRTMGLENKRQSGYKKGRCTADSILRLVEDSYFAFKKNGCLVALFVDMNKAFDAVWHRGLIYKMRKNNLPTKVVRLMTSFLTDRTFQVKENETLSAPRVLRASVPQGGILSPWLYKFYIHDVPTVEDENEDGAFYADDGSNWAAGYTVDQAETTIAKVIRGWEEWSSYWRAEPSPEKSEVMIITRNRELAKKKLNLKMLGQQIPQVQETQFLGVWIDSWLSWKKNTEEMIRKSSSRIQQVRSATVMFGQTQPNLIRQVISSILFSIFEYSCMLWMNMSQTQWDKINKFQVKSLRILNGLPIHTNSELILKHTGFEKVHTRLAILSARRIESMMKTAETLSPYAQRFLEYRAKREHRSILQYYESNEFSKFDYQSNCGLCIFLIPHPCVPNNVVCAEPGETNERNRASEGPR